MIRAENRRFARIDYGELFVTVEHCAKGFDRDWLDQLPSWLLFRIRATVADILASRKRSGMPSSKPPSIIPAQAGIC
jgi:hypothetical protein